jgi:hypothetical protein
MFLEVRGAHRGRRGEPRENELAEPPSRRHPGCRCSLVGPWWRQREVQRAVLGRDDGRLVGPVLIKAALLPEQGVDELGVERTETAEGDEQVITRHDCGRVELQAADRADERVDVVGRDRVRTRAAQSLARDRQPPRVLDPDLSVHDRNLSEPES